MRYCSEVRYFLSHDMYQEFTMYEPFVMAVALEYDLDIDGISDYCTENKLSFPVMINMVIEYLYSISDSYTKSKIFYRTVHTSRSMFDYIIHELAEELKEYLPRVNLNYSIVEEVHVNNIFNGLSDIYNLPKNDSFDEEQELKFQFFLNFEKIFVSTFNRLSKNVYFTFDEVNRMEYQKRKRKAGPVFSFTDTSNRVIYYNNNEVLSTVYNVTNTVFNTASSISYTSLTDTVVMNPTTSCSNYINYTTDQLFSGAYINTNIRNLVPEIKKSKTKGYSILKKSLKGISRFISSKDLIKMFKDGLIVIGKQYNFLIKVDINNLLKYSDIQDNSSITYTLELLNKDNEKICKICVVYKDCPILDEILTVYLSIKSGNESKIIEIGNHFSRTEIYKDYFPDSINVYLDNIREDAESRSNYAFIRLIRCWFEDRVSRYLKKEEIGYILDSDVSWDESIDYAGVNINVNVFDCYVKRFKWVEKTTNLEIWNELKAAKDYLLSLKDIKVGNLMNDIRIGQNLIINYKD